MFRRALVSSKIVRLPSSAVCAAQQKTQGRWCASSKDGQSKKVPITPQSLEALTQNTELLYKTLKNREDVIRRLIKLVPPEALRENGCEQALNVPAAEVTNEEELLLALANGCQHILLQPGTVYTIHEHIDLFDRTVDFCGGGRSCGTEQTENDSEVEDIDPPRIEGHWRIRGSSNVHASNVIFAGNSRTDAVWSVSGKEARLSLHNCCILGGREGVMTAGAAKVALNKCIVRECVRGVFESIRCRLTNRNCLFVENEFHLVLLSSPGERARVEEQSLMDNRFEGGRADIALKYNPVIDGYTECHRDGTSIVLTETDSTTNLADPTW